MSLHQQRFLLRLLSLTETDVNISNGHKPQDSPWSRDLAGAQLLK